MRGRALTSWVARALLLLGFVSCAWSGRATSSGVTSTHPQGTTGVAPDNQCFVIGSTCATTNDCCSLRCQNGYCEEQNGM